MSPSPSPPPSLSPREPQQPPSPIPLTSPLRTHPKRLLPALLSSTHPHGPLSGHPRSPTSQSKFEARRAEILRTMTLREMEARYEETAARVVEVLQESERRREEVEAEMEKLRMEREMERRVWGKLRGMGKEAR